MWDRGRSLWLVAERVRRAEALPLKDARGTGQASANNDTIQVPLGYASLIFEQFAFIY